MNPSLRPIVSSPLRDWMLRTHMTQYRLAALLDTTLRSVNFWATGRVMPDLVTAFRLQAVTGGAVTPEMWLGTAIGKALWNKKPIMERPELEQMFRQATRIRRLKKEHRHDAVHPVPEGAPDTAPDGQG